MSSPHHLGMSVEYEHIYFPSQYSHHNPLPLIKNSYFQIFRGFQEDCHEFYDPDVEWLKQCYLASSIANNKF